jgi:hypothetical protein
MTEYSYVGGMQIIIYKKNKYIYLDNLLTDEQIVNLGTWETLYSEVITVMANKLGIQREHMILSITLPNNECGIFMHPMLFPLLAMVIFPEIAIDISELFNNYNNGIYIH